MFWEDVIEMNHVQQLSHWNLCPCYSVEKKKILPGKENYINFKKAGTFYRNPKNLKNQNSYNSTMYRKKPHWFHWFKLLFHNCSFAMKVKLLSAHTKCWTLYSMKIQTEYLEGQRDFLSTNCWDCKQKKCSSSATS